MKQKLLFLLFSTSTMLTAQTDCSTALPLTLNSTNTAPAYTTETGVPPTNFCGLTNGSTKGKWYQFIAAQNINITVSTVLTQNNNADTRIIVYTGNCSALVCLVSNDDYNGTLSSQVSFNVITGTAYTIAFDNRYSQLGFDFTLMESPPPAPDRLSFTSQTVSGITGSYYNCVVDMNGDYKDDIVSAIDATHLAITYQQTGGTFNTTTFTVPNTTVLPSWSIAAGDYDNNGYNDLIYGSGSGVCFLKANSDGTGYTSDRKTQSYLVQRTNFVDINNDGKLDAFTCDDNSPNRYYLNDGTTLNHNQGGLGDFATGGNYGSIWFDYNNDGKLDMFIAKCGQGGSGVGGNINQMYKNNGDGTYTNVAATANLADPEQTWSSAVGDFNNDGWMDIVVGVNSTSNGNTNVKKNNGDGTFTSVTTGSGFDTITAMGREYVAHDFDNDGNLDVLGSGNTIMFGDGNFHFTANPNQYPLSAYNKPVGDLNNDGFLDIQNGTSVLFNNGNSNKWVKINLQGIQSNRNGIGARIEIYGAFGKQIRDVQSGTGFRNMSTLNTHFGLGSNTEVTQMIVRWPSGIVDTINNITANQTVLVVEGSSLAVNSFNNSTFTIYPNPVKSNINIVMSATSTVELKTAQVFDLNGRIVLETTISNQSINVDKLSTGTYILLLKDAEGKHYTEKFIKE
jgi:hypothetical protein